MKLQVTAVVLSTLVLRIANLLVNTASVTIAVLKCAHRVNSHATGRVNIRNARKHVQNSAIVRRVTSHARFCCRVRNTRVLDFVVNHVLKFVSNVSRETFALPSDWPRQS
jgi:hypothetical protein